MRQFGARRPRPQKSQPENVRIDEHGPLSGTHTNRMRQLRRARTSPLLGFPWPLGLRDENPVVGLAVALDELHVKKIAQAIGSPARFFLRLFARPGPAADLAGRKPRLRAAAQ